MKTRIRMSGLRLERAALAAQTTMKKTPAGKAWLGAVLALAAFAQACGSQPTDVGLGSTQLRLTLPDGRVVETVDWEITGGALGEPRVGSIDVGDEGDTVSAYIGGIPVAFGYEIMVSADLDDETCQGSAMFDIPSAGATTLVDMTLYCGAGGGDETGNIVLNVDFDLGTCPATTMVVSPLLVNVGNTIDLTATSAGSAPSYTWSASGGSIAEPNAAQSSFTCTAEGSVGIELMVDNGAGCSRTRTVQVVCAAADNGNGGSGVITEVGAPQPRVVLTYDGGVVVLDGTSLDTLASFDIAGFNRLNSVGDERHVALSTAGGWALVDTGAWTEPHGDHSHYYTTDPSLSGIIVDALTPGHVVVHDGYTVLFDDGTGQVTAVNVADWTEANEHGHFDDVVREYMSDAAHHGVAVLTDEDRMLVTLSDRSGAMLLDANDDVIAMSTECPGVHGETAFDGANGTEYMMVGCQDGVLLFEGDEVTKLSSPDAYGRIGNQFSSEGSDVVLGDYRNDPNAGLIVPMIALINVVDQTLTVVDPFEPDGVGATWRGLRRGDDGEVLVLGTDGALRVIDPLTGQTERSIDVIAPWTIPAAWQTAHPALDVASGVAYVTEPSTGTIYAVDYVSGAVVGSAQVGVEMNEVVGVEG